MAISSFCGRPKAHRWSRNKRLITVRITRGCKPSRGPGCYAIILAHPLFGSEVIKYTEIGTNKNAVYPPGK
jgi:hypothetical protein